jgi:hypothetical protein
MQALWRLQLTAEGAAGTVLERLTEAPPLLLPPAVKKALAHLEDKVRETTVEMVIELTCECASSERRGLCEELRGEGWEYPEAR